MCTSNSKFGDKIECYMHFTVQSTHFATPLRVRVSSVRGKKGGVYQKKFPRKSETIQGIRKRIFPCFRVRVRNQESLLTKVGVVGAHAAAL